MHQFTKDTEAQIDAAHAQNVSVELQVKQAALESTLSDTMVDMTHLQAQLALVNSKLATAYEHIEMHVLRENMLMNMLGSVEEMMGTTQHEMAEKLDVQELVGYRSYAQKREKEVKSHLDLLQNENDRKDVILKDQASHIAWLNNVVKQRSDDLELAIEDLKKCTNREWKKHRSVCMEIGGVYIDLNHKEEVGLTMDRSSKYGPSALGMTGIGLKIRNLYPFEIVGVHPDARTSDGLPAILHENDKIVAVDTVSLENLTKADVNGLIIGPCDTHVYLKIIRGVPGLEHKSRMTLSMKRLTLDPTADFSVSL